MKTLEDNDIMAFGKYRGQKLGDIPDSYIKWLVENTDILQEVKLNTERGAFARYCKLAYDSMTK